MQCTAHSTTRPALAIFLPTQEAIRELQLCTAVDNEELQRLGVKLELDEHSGKLRVTKRNSDGAPADRHIVADSP